MREAVVVASSRTPLAKSHRGSFNMTRPDDLAAHAIRDVLGKAPQLEPKEIEEVILGCGQPHGSQGHNIARVAALRAGLPVTTPGATVNRFCNSGLQAVVQAAHMVLQEGVEAAIGGGIESITMLQRDNSPNPWVKEHYPGLYMVMGDTAEVVAKRYHVSRQAQDEYSLSSQQRTARAQDEGFFKEEIAPMLVKKHGLRVEDIDVWELNEAFASQVVYCRDRLGLPMDRLNVNGGSISIGHPFGMTGSRLVGTIANELLRRRGRYGVVTMCVGGGQGAAALFEACR